MVDAGGCRCRKRPGIPRPRRLIIMVCTIDIIIVLFMLIIIHVGAFLHFFFYLETNVGILGQLFREEALQIHEQPCVCRYVVPSINPYGIANMLGHTCIR